MSSPKNYLQRKTKETKSTLEVDYYGNKIWRNKKGQIHRYKQPAIEYKSGGYKEWFTNGVRQPPPNNYSIEYRLQTIEDLIVKVIQILPR